jgi:hypothetical protein
MGEGKTPKYDELINSDSRLLAESVKSGVINLNQKRGIEELPLEQAQEAISYFEAKQKGRIALSELDPPPEAA